MNYRDDEGDAAEAVAVRRSRRDQDSRGSASRLDRLEKALHGTEDALGGLAEQLSPALMPEPPSALDGVATDEPRSELSARLERMCGMAERHRAFIRTLTERVDL
jgi:hypothetical protein